MGPGARSGVTRWFVVRCGFLSNICVGEGFVFELGIHLPVRLFAFRWWRAKAAAYAAAAEPPRLSYVTQE